MKELDANHLDLYHKGMKKFLLIIPVVIILLGGIFAVLRFGGKDANAPAPLDAFTQCLTDKGVKFYGAFWCPHCQNQKKMFGGSAKLLPYVECSTPDAQGQTELCKEKKVEGYPTWEFADGTRESGEVTLSKLAEKSSCLLPVNP